ncbi:MAG: ABC transporter substrate-binding protein [Halobacteria archaeon]
MRGRRAATCAPPRLLATFAGFVIPVLLLSACTSNPGDGRVHAAEAGYPVTVTSCGEGLTFNASPKRAVANDINMVEMMLALGLADRMAGIAGFQDREILPELRSDFEKVKVISKKYIELEPLLGVNPDFLFAGWNYGLGEAAGMTPNHLAQRGVKTYVLTESCAHVMPGKNATSIEETFGDIRNIGAIFNVTPKAEELVASQQAILAEVRDRVRGSKPVRVFVYDSAEDAPFTAPGLSIPTDLIERAGGVNIFADLKKTWTTVSWEQVASRNPECIVIVDYGEVTWQHKRDFMKTNPAFRNLTAVKSDCFLALPYAALTPGVRNAEAVRSIAKLLHPDRFSMPGTSG